MQATEAITVGSLVYRRSNAAGPSGTVLSCTDTHAVVQWDEGEAPWTQLVVIADLVSEPS